MPNPSSMLIQFLSEDPDQQWDQARQYWEHLRAVWQEAAVVMRMDHKVWLTEKHGKQYISKREYQMLFFFV